jgi:hypothetical protein
MMTGTHDVFDDIFGPELNPVAPEPPPVAAQLVGGDAHAKLGRNLDLALQRQTEILSKPITDETEPREKRLVADTAHMVVKTAAGIDASRLQARGDDDSLARIFQKIAEAKQRLGERLTAQGRERLVELDTVPEGEADNELS